jgi:hypothetical protein
MPRTRKQSARTAAPAEVRGHRAAVLPGPPYVERSGEASNAPTVLTEAGYQVVELVAREGGKQRLIASKLGLTFSAFKRLLDRDEQCRLRYEAGVAELEHEVGALLLKSARAGAVVPAIYFSKAVLGWRENDVVVPPGQVGIQIVLPDSLTPEQWALRQQQRAAALALPGPPIIDVTATPIEENDNGSV